MKKLFIVSLLALSVSPAFAKKKIAKPAPVPASFCFRLGFGYTFPVAGNEAMMYLDNVQPISGTQSFDGTYNTYDLKKASLSAGFSATIAPGVMFNDHIGVEVAAVFGLAMKKYSLHYTSTAPGAALTDNFTSNAKLPVVIIPALIVSTGNSNMLSGYARVGIALPVSGKIITNESYSDNQGTVATTFEVKNHFSLGLSGAAGVRYNLNKHFGLWLEVNGLAMSLQPKSGQYTSYAQDGQPVDLSTINYNDVHFQYTHSFSEKNNNNQSVPTQANAFATPFSNIGVALGVSVNL